MKTLTCLMLLLAAEAVTAPAATPPPRLPTCSCPTNGALGIATTALDPPLAAQLGLKRGQGVLVVSVQRSHAGDRAGLKRHDVITHLDGHLVKAASFESRLRQLPAGRRVRLRVMRTLEPIELVATIEGGSARTSHPAARGARGGGRNRRAIVSRLKTHRGSRSVSRPKSYSVSRPVSRPKSYSVYLPEPDRLTIISQPKSYSVSKTARDRLTITSQPKSYSVSIPARDRISTLLREAKQARAQGQKMRLQWEKILRSRSAQNLTGQERPLIAALLRESLKARDEGRHLAREWESILRSQKTIERAARNMRRDLDRKRQHLERELARLQAEAARAQASLLRAQHQLELKKKALSHARKEMEERLRTLQARQKKLEAEGKQRMKAPRKKRQIL